MHAIKYVTHLLKLVHHLPSSENFEMSGRSGRGGSSCGVAETASFTPCTDSKS